MTPSHIHAAAGALEAAQLTILQSDRCGAALLVMQAAWVYAHFHLEAEWAVINLHGRVCVGATFCWGVW